MSSATHPTPPAALGRDMAAALREGLAFLRKVMADPDPKLALKGVAELTKLLGVCARCKRLPITLDEPVERVESARPDLPSCERPEVSRPTGTDGRDTPGRSPDQCLSLEPGRSQFMSVLESFAPDRRTAPHPMHRPLSPTGKQLTSFLGNPTPAQKPPDRGKSV